VVQRVNAAQVAADRVAVPLPEVVGGPAAVAGQGGHQQVPEAAGEGHQQAVEGLGDLFFNMVGAQREELSVLLNMLCAGSSQAEGPGEATTLRPKAAEGAARKRQPYKGSYCKEKGRDGEGHTRKKCTFLAADKNGLAVTEGPEQTKVRGFVRGLRGRASVGGPKMSTLDSTETLWGSCPDPFCWSEQHTSHFHVCVPAH
jgi:hypothetical protein